MIHSLKSYDFQLDICFTWARESISLGANSPRRTGGLARDLNRMLTANWLNIVDNPYR